MPTILLQEIIDLLNSWKEGLGTQLEQALESLSNLEDNTDELETYLSSIDNYLSSINHDVVAISEDTASINVRINTISGIISDINSKLATSNNHLNNISSNTASVVTPVTNIKSNTDTLVQNSNSINANVSAVSNNIGTISANTGISATYTEATATNTGNILQKVTTMASDTTQLRADNQNILDVLDSINDAVQQIPHDVHASDVLYDPSTSGLIATNVQDAIDALSSDLSDKVDTSDFNASVMPISASDSTATKTYIDNELNGKVDKGACVSFALDYPSAITGLVKYANGCYYNPQTNEVHINIVIYSNNNNIPNNGGVIATIPSEYRPNAERVIAIFAEILDSNNTLHFEAIQPIGTNGEIKLHNFVYAGNINTICMNFVYYK